MKSAGYSLKLLQWVAFAFSVYAFYDWDTRYLIYSPVFFYIYFHIGTSIGLHRYFVHRSFSTSKRISYVIAFFSTLSLVGSPLLWALIHRQHHLQSDDDKDPHSFRKTGVLSILLGTWYDGLPLTVKNAQDLSRDRALLWAHRNFFKIILSWMALLTVIDPKACIYFYLLPVCISVHVSSFNLILHHFSGYRNFPTKDHSKNNWWMFPISLGESWHNNHHQYPARYSTKVFWWELDPCATLIRIIKTNKDVV